MNTLKNWVRGVSGGARKALIICGLIAGFAMATAPAANAQAWSFSYAGSGINVSGQVNAVWSAIDNLWSVTSISGTHNGDAITGLWTETGGPNSGTCPGGICNRDQDNNFLAGSNFSSPAWCCGTQVDLHFIAAGIQYSFGYITNYNAPMATEGPSANMDHPYTGRCNLPGPNGPPNGCTEITQVQFTQVPEINASAGLEALALLLLFGLIFREMFLRSRSTGLSA